MNFLIPVLDGCASILRAAIYLTAFAIFLISTVGYVVYIFTVEDANPGLAFLVWLAGVVSSFVLLIIGDSIRFRE